MATRVVGLRFEPNGALVFAYAAGHSLARGRRVRVTCPDGVREAVVAIAPEQFIAAPALGDAPTVAGVVAGEAVETDIDAAAAPDVPPEVVFLPADGGDLGTADLRRALEMAARPLPAAPDEERRR